MMEMEMKKKRLNNEQFIRKKMKQLVYGEVLGKTKRMILNTNINK